MNTSTLKLRNSRSVPKSRNRSERRLESLEDRTLLSQVPGMAIDVVPVNDIDFEAAVEVGVAQLRMHETPEKAFVTGMYQRLLGRLPDAGGLEAHTQILTETNDRAAVIAGITSSPEYLGNMVDAYYLGFLGREADAGGRANWVAALSDGMPEQEVIVSFLTSNEHQQAHPTDVAYVGALYDQILGRTPEASEVNSWVTQLDAGVSRAEVANGFLNSDENLINTVNDSYGRILGRSADGLGGPIHVTMLKSGEETPMGLLANLAGSEECFDQALEDFVRLSLI